MSKSTDEETVKKWQNAAQDLKDNGTFKKICDKWIKYMVKTYNLKTEFKNDVFYFWKD